MSSDEFNVYAADIQSFLLDALVPCTYCMPNSFLLEL